MTQIIKSGPNEGRYYIVIHKGIHNGKELFNVCVYDHDKTDTSWNDWIVNQGADTEAESLEIYDDFMKEYYPEQKG